MQVLEHPHVGRVTRHDVGSCIAVELVQSQRRLVPGQAVLRGRVQQVPSHIMHRARAVHLGDHVLVRQHAFVPDLEDLLLLVPQNVRVQVVQSVLPGLVVLEQGIARLLHHSARGELGVHGAVDHPAVEHQMLQGIRCHEVRLRRGNRCDEEEAKRKGSHGNHTMRGAWAMSINRGVLNAMARARRLW